MSQFETSRIILPSGREGKILHRNGKVVICDQSGKAQDCSLGACCGGQSRCLGEQVTRTKCDDLGGWWYKNGSLGSGAGPIVTCREACYLRGSCCNSNTGECLDEVPKRWCRQKADRTGEPWTWEGGESCQRRDPPCEPRGRCCNFWTGECNNNKLSDVCGCRGSKWIWSFNQRCNEGDPCRAHGACCRVDGSCDVTLESECNGSWRNGAPCCTCSVQIGSCCVGGIGCSDGVTQLECQLRDPGPGVFSNLPCRQRQNQPDCRQVIDRGACCDSGGPNRCNGPCTNCGFCCCDKTFEDCMCEFKNGRRVCYPRERCWNWVKFSPCGGGTCNPEQFYGSCCLPNGNCSHTTQFGCQQAGGSWASNTPCRHRGRNCGVTIYGSCCNARHDICNDNVPKLECLARNNSYPCGEWTYSSIPCKRRSCLGLDRGACCNHTPIGGICHCNVTRNFCDRQIGFTEWFEGQQCQDINCNSESEWGACCNRDLNRCLENSSANHCATQGSGWVFHWKTRCRFIGPPCGAPKPLCPPPAIADPSEIDPSREPSKLIPQVDLDSLADDGLILGSDGLVYSGDVSQGSGSGEIGVDPKTGGCGCGGNCTGDCADKKSKIRQKDCLEVCNDCSIMKEVSILGIKSKWCGSPILSAFGESEGCGCNVQAKSLLYSKSGGRTPGCPKGLWPGQEIVDG